MPGIPASDAPAELAGPTPFKAASGVHGVGADTLFKAGDRVAENIELVSLLGVGGMGDVWLANHLGLDTTVAVKFMSPALAHDGALIERFGREAKLASRIKSPHVVQIFDFATTPEGIPYIVMELIEGETLEARIQRESKLGLDETSRLLVQLCRALSKAHETGIIHRDMKPENVLLGEEEGELFARILDFGIAKHIDAPKVVTDVGVTMGTPSYMSPEQLFHPADVDHRSDLWSLGVMTYLCLTGSLPFSGDSLGAFCLAINDGRYRPASKLNLEIPRAMDAWFSKALSVSSEKRFRSAKEMSDAYLLILERAGQLPSWAVRKDSVGGEPPTFAGGTGGISASLVPARHVRGSRRRAAAVVVGGAMLVAIGFLSRDASLGRFARAHVPTQWAARVDRLRAGSAIVTPFVETPNVVATAGPLPVETVLLAEPPVRRIEKVSHVEPSVLPPAVATVVISPPVKDPTQDRDTTPTLGAQVVVPPSPESESDPYSESDAPSAVSALPPPNPPSSSFPHAPPL